MKENTSTKFVKVIFTDDEWMYLEQLMSKLPKDDMVLDVLSALDDGMVLEESHED